ncbi:MAG TPA: glycosyltransferase [Geopsychrobacteraceae bacterium]|nr:glycosyltransferase [Geopsychrobacteraceae bacterium]
MQPQVSILLPVRNEEQHLITALRSLQRQTFRNWELVVVDDGSSDTTPDILETFATKDPRVQIIRQPATGLVSALNRGLEACKTPYVARMDGDDVCHPDRLGKQFTVLQNDPSLTLVASCVRHFPRMNVQGGMLAYEEWQNENLSHTDISRNLFIESPFAHPSVMYRRDAVFEIGGYRQKNWAEDYDLWLRLAEQGARFARCPETLLYWRDRPQRLTRTADNCSLEAFRACKAHFLKRSYLKESSEVTLWGVGLEGKAWRKVLRREGVKVDRWIDVDQRKIGQRIHGATVYHPDILKDLPGPTLITVGARGARVQIRQWAESAGLKEGLDYICVT